MNKRWAKYIRTRATTDLSIGFASVVSTTALATANLPPFKSASTASVQIHAATNLRAAVATVALTCHKG